MNVCIFVRSENANTDHIRVIRMRETIFALFNSVYDGHDINCFLNEIDDFEKFYFFGLQSVVNQIQGKKFKRIMRLLPHDQSIIDSTSICDSIPQSRHQ